MRACRNSNATDAIKSSEQNTEPLNRLLNFGENSFKNQSEAKKQIIRNRLLFEDGYSSNTGPSNYGQSLTYIEEVMRREGLRQITIPYIQEEMPLSTQIKMHLQHRNRELSKSSSKNRSKVSPTKMSSLSRSPPSRVIDPSGSK